MFPLIFGAVGSSLYCLLLLLTSVFLILLILIQRGRGGGLSGALGGAGGQSAFGAKAGDTFTRITIGVSTFWIVLCILGAMFLSGGDEGLLSSQKASPVNAVGGESGEFVGESLTDDLGTDAADVGEAIDTAGGEVVGDTAAAADGEANSSDNETTAEATPE